MMKRWHALLEANPLLAQCVWEGLISPPTIESDVPPPRHPVMPFEQLMDELPRDREDR